MAVQHLGAETVLSLLMWRERNFVRGFPYFLFPFLGNICPKSPLSETCIQLLTSPFPPGGESGREKGIDVFYKSSWSEVYREGAGLPFRADFGFMLEKLPHKALKHLKEHVGLGKTS